MIRHPVVSPSAFLPCDFLNEIISADVLAWDMLIAALTHNMTTTMPLSPPQYIYEDAKLLLRPFKVKEFLKELVCQSILRSRACVQC